MRSRLRTSSAAVVAAVVLAGCGGSDAADTEGTIRNGQPDPWTEQQVIDALGLLSQPVEVTKDGDLVPMRPAEPGDVGMETRHGCVVDAVLTSAEEVDLYSGAGDTVVTNPDGTAGVKTSNDPGCLAALEADLAKLD